MIPTILQSGHPILRKKAAEVPVREIESEGIKRVLREMQAALLSQGDGVALAAPQIGVSLRIFIVSKLALQTPKRLKDREDTENLQKQKRDAGFLAFINPHLTKLSREKALVDEGCLSVRPLYGKIRRSKKAAISAYDERGRKVTRGASGLLAQVFQHELDHLDGVLFTDRAVEVKNLPPERQNPKWHTVK